MSVSYFNYSLSKAAEEKLKEAVIKAINEIGIEEFKKTSMFLSSEKK